MLQTKRNQLLRGTVQRVVLMMLVPERLGGNSFKLANNMLPDCVLHA